MVRMLKQQLMKWAVTRHGVALSEWHVSLADMVININTQEISTLLLWLVFVVTHNRPTPDC